MTPPKEDIFILAKQDIIILGLHIIFCNEFSETLEKQRVNFSLAFLHEGNG